MVEHIVELVEAKAAELKAARIAGGAGEGRGGVGARRYPSSGAH